MNQLKKIKINNKSYYNAKDIKKIDISYFQGGPRGVRKIIEKKNIKAGNYMYAECSTVKKEKVYKFSKNQLEPSKKAQLLLKKSWCIQNIPICMGKNVSEERKQEQYDYPEAPGILELEEEEKFKDNEGNCVKIETRGVKTADGIYFLAKDVAIAFEMPNLTDIISKKNTKHEKNIHYNVFNCIETNNVRNKVNKTYFITYKGMLKILFSSHSKKAEKFVDWATNTLFVAQMGEVEEKEELASKLIGVPVKSLRLVLSKTSSSVPCVYMFSLGVAKDLRNVMNIPDDVEDDYIIIKYGFTKCLDRRTSEHITTYGKIKKVNLELLYYSYIDPVYLSDAEKDIKDFVSQYETIIKYENFKELIAISPQHEKTIKKQLKYINKEYAGCTQELTKQIEELKQVIKDKNRDIEDEKKETIKYKKEIENLNKIHNIILKSKNQEIENEILKRKLINEKNENLKMKYENLEKKNKKLKKDLKKNNNSNNSEISC
jgi:hypothetical protein